VNGETAKVIPNTPAMRALVERALLGLASELHPSATALTVVWGDDAHPLAEVPASARLHDNRDKYAA
jgi:hypothetical protein